MVSIIDTSCCTKECFTPPENFRLVLIDQNTGLNAITEGTYHRDSLKLFYQSDNLKLVDLLITDFMEFEDVLISQELPWNSALSSIKTYYLYLNKFDTDTLYVDVIKKSEDCCTWHEYIDVKYNGKTLTLNKDLVGYLVNK